MQRSTVVPIKSDSDVVLVSIVFCKTLTSTLELTRINQSILLNKAIGIINFAKHSQNFIDDTMI